MTNRELDELIRAFEGYSVKEALKEFKKLRSLVRKTPVFCERPSGRFAEDKCGKCIACRLRKAAE